MDNIKEKPGKWRKGDDTVDLELSQIMKSGIVHMDCFKRGKIYYMAKTKIEGYEAGFVFGVDPTDFDDKFIFKSIEHTKVFRSQIRECIDNDTIKRIF